MVVGIVEVIGCLSDFRLLTAPEIFVCFMACTRALFDDVRRILPVPKSKTEKPATHGTLC